ncbi:TPA: EamA family transporter, partial [Bacillus anthracis]|nr:EamA family transporter [Bacillus anthracis]
GYIILGEPLNPIMGIGACFILVGVFLANRSTLRTYFKQGRLFEKEM